MPLPLSLKPLSRSRLDGFLLVSADLRVQFRRQVIFDAHRPLADRPVVPDVAHPVADLGAAERQVLEVAGEAVEVFALAEAADFDIELLIEKNFC